MAAGPVSKLFSQPVEPKPGLIDQHRLGIELGQDVPSGRRPALRLRQVLFCLEIHFGLSVASFINRTKPHARQTTSALKAFLDRERVRQEWVETLPPRKDLFRKLADLRHEIGF